MNIALKIFFCVAGYALVAAFCCGLFGVRWRWFCHCDDYEKDQPGWPNRCEARADSAAPMGFLWPIAIVYLFVRWPLSSWRRNILVPLMKWSEERFKPREDR